MDDVMIDDSNDDLYNDDRLMKMKSSPFKQHQASTSNTKSAFMDYLLSSTRPVDADFTFRNSAEPQLVFLDTDNALDTINSVDGAAIFRKSNHGVLTPDQVQMLEDGPVTQAAASYENIFDGTASIEAWRQLPFLVIRDQSISYEQTSEPEYIHQSDDVNRLTQLTSISDDLQASIPQPQALNSFNNEITRSLRAELKYSSLLKEIYNTQTHSW